MVVVTEYFEWAKRHYKSGCVGVFGHKRHFSADGRTSLCGRRIYEGSSFVGTCSQCNDRAVREFHRLNAKGKV